MRLLRAYTFRALRPNPVVESGALHAALRAAARAPHRERLAGGSRMKERMTRSFEIRPVCSWQDDGQNDSTARGRANVYVRAQ
jgi:hypothetical protein